MLIIASPRNALAQGFARMVLVKALRLQQVRVKTLFIGANTSREEQIAP